MSLIKKKFGSLKIIRIFAPIIKQAMEKISKEDFIIFNTKTKQPKESLDIVYHYTSIIELINTRSLTLLEDEEIISVADLPIDLQIKINNAIKFGS